MMSEVRCVLCFLVSNFPRSLGECVYIRCSIGETTDRAMGHVEAGLGFMGVRVTALRVLLTGG